MTTSSELLTSSRVPLWTAVRAQAQAWADTEPVHLFASELPRNGRPGDSGLRDILQEIRAGADSMFAHPFRLPSLLPMAASVVPRNDFSQLRGNHPEWFEAAVRVETAHRATVAWLRARLPGYPMLPAPYLVPNTPFTTLEYTDHMIWTPGERAKGLHKLDPAPDVTQLLGVDGRQAAAIVQSARDVAAALAVSPEWAQLAGATIALDPAGRQALSQARTNLKQRLAPESVDQYEPNLALPRNEYRAASLREEVDALDGSAADYARAFGAANDLIEHAASDVMSQLACYPMSQYTPADLDVQEPGTPMLIEFVDANPDIFWPSPGEIGWVDDDLVHAAVVIYGVRINFAGTGAGSTRLTVRTIPGTGDAWRRPPT